MPTIRKDYTGKTCGTKLILGLAYFNHHNDPVWKFRCLLCGREATVTAQNMKSPRCRGCYLLSHPTRKRPYESLYNAFVQKSFNRFPVKISYEEFVALTKIGECHYCGSNIVWSEFQTRVKGSKKRQGTNSYGNYILNSLERNKMKCFRIESGGERFYWAGESQEGVLAEFKDNYDDFDDPAEILELSDDEMASITVTVEDENTEPNDTSTLKQLFDDKTKTCIGGDFELCGSVF